MTQNPLIIRLPEELAEALRTYAFVTHTSANRIVEAALTEYLKAHAHTDIVRARSTRRSTCTPSRSKSSNARGTCDVLIGSLPIRLPIAHDLLRVLAVVALPQLSLQRSRLVSMLHQAPVPRLVDVSQRIPQAQQRPQATPPKTTNPNPAPSEPPTPRPRAPRSVPPLAPSGAASACGR